MDSTQFIFIDYSSNTLLSVRDVTQTKSENQRIEIKWALTNKIIGISGDSGSGKTTLLKQMAGLRLHKGATLNINGELIDLRRPSINPCVYVGADAPLFEHLTLQENLVLIQTHSQWSNSGKARRLCEALNIQGLSMFSIEQVSNLCEIEPLLQQRVSVLSGGEKQRAQLARALLSGKPILLLDEAFSAMDWSLRTRLHKRLIELAQAKGRAIVMVSHSLRELALMSDNLVHIVKGSISSEGPTLEQIEVLQQNEDVLFSALRVRHLNDDSKYDLSIFELADASDKIKLYAKQGSASSSTDRLLVDANTVVLSKQREPQSSMLNQVHARIDSILETPNLAVVRLNVGGQCLYSHISKKSYFDMQLAPGDSIYAMFKAV